MSDFQREYTNHFDPMIGGRHVNTYTDVELTEMKLNAQTCAGMACYAESAAQQDAEEKRWWGVFNAVTQEQQRRAMADMVAKQVSMDLSAILSENPQ